MNEAQTRQAVINSIDAVVRVNILNAKPDASLFAARSVFESLNQEKMGIPMDQINPGAKLNELTIEGGPNHGQNLDSLDWVEIGVYLDDEADEYHHRAIGIGMYGDELDELEKYGESTVADIATIFYRRLESE